MHVLILPFRKKKKKKERNLEVLWCFEVQFTNLILKTLHHIVQMSVYNEKHE